MKIDDALIRRVSTLSRLSLTDEEVRKFTKDFQEILDAFKVIDEIDVSGAKSSFRPVEERNILRDDIPAASITNKEALKFSKHTENGYFIGPKTIE
jgi:aspartyl-tRNA(Asn)/glutamyl-tRNA(Gln) amidotransferase subunit C